MSRAGLERKERQTSQRAARQDCRGYQIRDIQVCQGLSGKQESRVLQQEGKGLVRGQEAVRRNPCQGPHMGLVQPAQRLRSADRTHLFGQNRDSEGVGQGTCDS